MTFIDKEECKWTLQQEKITELQGFKLHVIETDKYKTNTFVWKMKAPLTKEDVTKRALLPHVLQSNSAKYTSTTAFGPI